MPFSILNTALALGVFTTGGAAGHAEQPHVNQQHCSHQVQVHQKDSHHREQVSQKSNHQKMNDHSTTQTTQQTQTAATTQTSIQSSSSVTAPNAFLQMVAQRESGGNITAINPTSGAAGKYQFMQSTWDTVAPAEWKGKSPASAPESVQDAAALALYNLAGTSPWAL